MKRLLWLALFLAGPLAGQAPTAKVVATCGLLTLQPGQLTYVYVDATGKTCVLTAAGANPAGGWLDSLKILDSLTGIRGTVKVSLSAADSVQLRTGVKHAARVTVDSLLHPVYLDSVSLAHVTLGVADSVALRTGTRHAARVAVDSILAGTTHVGRVAVDSILAGTTHVGRVAVDSILAGVTHIGRVTVDSQLDSIRLKAGRLDSLRVLQSILAGATHIGAVNVDSVQQSFIHSDSCVTGTGAKSAADSALLPAVAGKRHYLTFLHVLQTDSTTAIVGAIPDTVSTTNLPGALLWKVGNAIAAGVSNTVVSTAFPFPIKSITANTVTKIRGSAPGTGGYWSINVCYFLGP